MVYSANTTPPIWWKFVPGILLCLMPGCNSGNTAADSASAQATPSAQDRPVCVIVSGDTFGWIIPCGCTSNQSGGLLRRGTYIASKAKEANVIVADAGGATDGTAPYQKARFRAILNGEALMNVVAHNLGAAELACGSAVLHELSAETGVSFISANAKNPDGGFICQTHVLLKRSGQKVLLTGVVSPDFATDEISVSEPIDAVLSVVESVDRQYDRLIVLAYLPVDQLRQLAESLPEADAVIGGPTGQSLAPERTGRTIVTSATNKGKFLAELTLASAKSAPVARIVEMSTDLQDHASQQKNLDQFRQFLDERDFTAQESGFRDAGQLELSSGLTISGTESCRDCHEETNNHWDSTGHAHAWQRLVHEGAHVDSYCQQCHTTGYGLPGGFVSAKLSPKRNQVGCESCHGPSSAHVEDSSVRTPFDAVDVCRKCHDPENSPAFEFDSYWEKIRHE